jgi:hypothetical protein
MYLSSCSAAVLALASVAQTTVLHTRDLLQDLQKTAMQSLKEAESNNGSPKSCKIENASVRQDWYIISASANV